MDNFFSKRNCDRCGKSLADGFSMNRFAIQNRMRNRNTVCFLANMEAINSEYINDQIPQAERLMKLNRIAISQMRILSEVSGRKLLADSEAQEK